MIIFNDNSLNALPNELNEDSSLHYFQVDLNEYRRDVFNTKILKVRPYAFMIGAHYSLYKQDVDDVVQDAKISTWEKVRNLPIKNFLTFNIGQYFLTCFRHGAIKFGKYRKKFSFDDIDEVDANTLPDILSRDEVPDFLMDFAAQIEKIKKLISERDFKMFELFGVYGKSHQEIADELGFNNASTVGTRINRIRAKMRALRKKGGV
jgi:RNA polymerase sigma factor (sigma-70 family)